MTIPYSTHQRIALTTLYYPLTVHGKFNSKWGHAVDCGLHTGEYSVTYADMFDQVTSIDAVITPEANEKLGVIEHVNLISHCLYSATGDEVTFYKPENDPALGSLYKSFLFHNLDDITSQTSIVEYKLTTTKLDDIINTPVDYLKTDLEGADGEAILGAIEVISKYRPTVVTDMNDYLIAKILKNLGYKRYHHTQEEWCKDAIYLPEETLIFEVGED